MLNLIRLSWVKNIHTVNGGLRLFDTFEEAERFIMWEKERQETDTKRTKLKTSWQCMGEY